MLYSKPYLRSENGIETLKYLSVTVTARCKIFYTPIFINVIVFHQPQQELSI